jgi:hypothetical protein
MDAVGVAVIGHRMRVGQAQIPGFAGPHPHRRAIEQESDAGIGGDRNVQPRVAPIGGEIVVVVLLDPRSGRQPHQPYRLQRALERRHDLSDIGCRLEDRGIDEVGRVWRGIGLHDRMRRARLMAQRQDIPLPLVILANEMIGPGHRLDRREVGLQPCRVERQRQPRAIGQRQGRLLRPFGQDKAPRGRVSLGGRYRSYSPSHPVAKRLMSNPDTLARLHAMILVDEALADRLALIEDRGAFAAAAAEAGCAAGISIAADAILAAERRDPLGLDRFAEMPITMTDWPGRNWLPGAIVPTHGQLAIDWIHFGNIVLSDSFFDMSLRRARPLPINALLRMRTPLAVLAKTPPPDATSGPDGLVFHMSRCGSTLVSQMLAAMPGGVVASEAPPLDAAIQLVHSHPEAPLEQRIALLRGMAAALGRDRFGNRRHYVIKTDSWHSLELPLFRAAFPDTPWLFLFREPKEVIVSQLRARGSQMIPGSQPESVFAIPDPLSLSGEEYIARVLARVTRAAIDHADLGGGLFVDYADLPDAMERRILPHFGIAADADSLSAARAGKRRNADDSVRAASAAHLDETHRELTALAARR